MTTHTMCPCLACRALVGIVDTVTMPYMADDPLAPYLHSGMTLAQTLFPVFALDSAPINETMPVPAPFTCSHCDKEQDADLRHDGDYDGSPLCESCYENEYVTANDGTVLVSSDAVYLEALHAPQARSYEGDEGNYPVNDCMNCPRCSEYSHNSRVHRYNGISNGICEACVHAGDYVWMAEASSYYSADCDGIYYHESDGEYHFEPEPDEDSGEETRKGNRIYGHDTNCLNILGYFGEADKGRERLTNNRALFLGVELEVDQRSASANRYAIADTVLGATDFGTYGIVKEDATCSGGEYVSVPATLRAHKHKLAWDKYLAALRPIALGYAGRDNGMHIHVNRAALSPLTAGRILVFMNDLSNAKFLTCIAQRHLSDCADWTKLEGKKSLKDGTKRSRNRYVIVNVAETTLEFRMFKSTLVLSRFYKNLEFVHAVCMWCRDAGAVTNLTPENLCAYVAQNRSTYPHLHKFIHDRWTHTDGSCEHTE